ncbi:MAG: carboxypeptidase regulatory-like domain-containing protein [Planctomycetia bacterium]|nr:carboxypeptidase regulatory-like domain-containing protein [Planctomycetia bacterium]
MKQCPWCHRDIPENATRCPHPDCGRLLPPAPASPYASPPSVPASPYAAPTGNPLPPPPRPMAAPPLPGGEEKKRVEPPVAPFQPPGSPSSKRVEPPVAPFQPPGSPSSKRVEPPVKGFQPPQPPTPDRNPQKRYEPPVNSTLPGQGENPQKRYEPPVNSSLPGQGENPQKRYEPPVNSSLPGQGGRNYEPTVNSVAPPLRRVEPPVAPMPAMMGMFNVFAPRGMGNHYLESDASFLPELRGDETSEELQLREELRNLHLSARKRYRRGKKMTRAISLLVLSALAVSAWFWYATVWSYAELDSRITIQRDTLDPSRIILTYTGTSTGDVGISREDSVRKTVLLDRVTSGMCGESQHFQWRIRGLRAGDKIGVTYREGFQVVERELSVPATAGIVMVTGNNTLSGLAVNALDGKPLSGVEVRVRGFDISAKTGAEGTFVLEKIPDGTQTFEISAAGYMKETFVANISTGEASDIRVAMSPGLKEGEIRLVLTWEKTPQDLDAHLEGPLPNNERFHISFQEKGDLKSKEFVQLDCDAREGFGPETITVLGVVPGTYKYYIHDYTNQQEVESTELSNSNAQVKVYFGGQTYTFRPEPEQKGNLWNVCEIVISDDLKATVQKLGTYEGKKIEGLGLYEKRTREDRMDWIEQYGGNSESETAVKAALEWLARHQCKKKGKSFGSWGRYGLLSNDKRFTCRAKDDKCTDTVYMESTDYVMASTGLAVLAFQAGGHFCNNHHKYSENVKNGLEWMVRNQLPNGLLLTPGMKKYPGSEYHEKFMYEHGIASFALAEACAVAKATGQPVPKKYEAAMKKAMDFIVKTQHADGGWRYKVDKDEESDTSVTGWQVLALKSAKEAGYKIPNKTIDRIRLLFKNRTNGVRTRYTKSMAGTEALTGIGMLVRQFLLDERHSEYVTEAADHLSSYAASEWKAVAQKDRMPDFYSWYKCSLAMQQFGGRPWDKWNEIVRNELVRLQKKEGCESGSWDPFDDTWGEYGGRVYTTALGALSLQVYYRYATEEDRVSGLKTSHGRVTARTTEEAAPTGKEKSPKMKPDEDAVLKDLDAGSESDKDDE